MNEIRALIGFDATNSTAGAVNITVHSTPSIKAGDVVLSTANFPIPGSTDLTSLFSSTIPADGTITQLQYSVDLTGTGVIAIVLKNPR
jgi:hypothetical protein